MWHVQNRTINHSSQVGLTEYEIQTRKIAFPAKNTVWNHMCLTPRQSYHEEGETTCGLPTSWGSLFPEAIKTGNLLFSVMLPFKLGLQILLHNSYTRTSFIPSRHCLLTSMTWMSVSSCGESVYCIPPPWPLVHNVRSGRRIFHAHKQMLALKRKRFCKQSSYVWFSEIKR